MKMYYVGQNEFEDPNLKGVAGAYVKNNAVKKMRGALKSI